MDTKAKRYLELAACVAGIYVCFLTWGVTQERVSTTAYDNGKRFRHFVFLNLCQALIAAGVGFIYMTLRGQRLSALTGPLLSSYTFLAFISSIASPFGYAALKHIDYPTLVLGKSCKLIPVMLMNFLIYGRTFSMQKYLVVFLITLGVSCFMMLQPVDATKPSKGAVPSSVIGISLLSINLLLDGAMNSIQDRIFSRFKVSGISMMVYVNLVSFALMGGYLLVAPYTNEIAEALVHMGSPVMSLLSLESLQHLPVVKTVMEGALLLNPHTNELWEAIAFCRQHPAVLSDIVLFGFAGALGQCFVYHTLENFGAIVLVTATVTRKMFSILISIRTFNHIVSPSQWAAVALVFFGICLEAFGKGGKGKSKKAADHITEVIDDVPAEGKTTQQNHSDSLKKRSQVKDS
ncbi:hypothetical protein BASA50_006748 [Batrachochytrium salamandrivorans]|uniref:UDP-galactose transporter homolog 1 n=1 Tax=Batrachochytrium salamandrivorans TaxID=1357716 RepID=A0ABQ8F8Z8_9FUNG|nr:hypothetical protein BASA60_006919 [Batrachochytrium salamandrivorans]KAH6576464.1 hypothetical protein BASA62_001385 [Batrachochytrium salamandrivorans]KAH6590504.1 hypothetical protein BASA61_005263 [Batrachochytrium salamandrivorans]KAH6594277.1 hypothetical protein BASA50_006748 [Batrachochytrium salamandrivorans]KAH9270042.1 hypothetical protein BASA83_007871 [Batrachochytrium salamandrivorans]